MEFTGLIIIIIFISVFNKLTEWLDISDASQYMTDDEAKLLKKCKSDIFFVTCICIISYYYYGENSIWFILGSVIMILLMEITVCMHLLRHEIKNITKPKTDVLQQD
jgi:hypothetical protein